MGELWLLAVLGGLVTLTVMRLFSAERRVKRLMRKIPRTLIHDVRDGQAVKIVGKLRFLGAPLNGPLSGRRCGYYLFTVTENPNRKDEKELVRDEQRRDFILEDPTGRALVRVAHALVFAKRDRKLHSGLFAEPSPALTELLSRHHQSPVGYFFNRDLKYEESVLGEIEDVAVGGVARWEADPDGESSSYRDPPRRLVIEAVGKVPLFVTDDPTVMR